MIITLNLLNSESTDVAYSYHGYVQLWISKYGSISNPSAPGDFLFRKLIGNIPVTTVNSQGKAVVEVPSSFIEVNPISTDDYLYIEARYFLNDQEVEYTTEDTNFVSPKTFYFDTTASPDAATINLDFSQVIQNLEPDRYSYTFKITNAETGKPLSNIKVSAALYDAGHALLEALPDSNTDSLGAVTFPWTYATSQDTIKLTVTQYVSAPSFDYSLSELDKVKQALVEVSAEVIEAADEDIVPGITTDGLVQLLTFSEPVSQTLLDFLNDPAHPLTTLRAIRKHGYLAELSGYDLLNTTDKENLKRINAHARLNLVYFPETTTEVIDKFVKFNDLLITASTPVYSAIDIVNNFSSGEFVAHGRVLRDPITPTSDQPSDFALAAMYTTAKHQVQLATNLVTGAAADLKYKNGTNAGSIVFGTDSSHGMDCECEECLTAVSPFSYLTSLIGYAGQTIKENSSGKFTNIQSLSSFLSQPLNEMTLDCDLVEKKLCTFRLQVETLYKYKLSLPLATPLSLVSGCKAAYGFRKLSDTYTGSAVRVRRSSDDTETDIGFLDGRFDSGAFLNFIGIGTGWCVKLYDQSGNGKDFQQTNTSWQPEVKINGLGIPFLDLQGANRFEEVTPVKSYWKFLHDGTGEHILMGAQAGDSLNPNLRMYYFCNSVSTNEVGAIASYDDLATSSRNNAVVFLINKGLAGNPTVSGQSNDVWLPDVVNQLTFSYKTDAAVTDDFKFRVNSTTEATANTANTPSTADPSRDLVFFARPDVNPGTAGSYPVSGPWFEYLFYGDISTSDRDLLEGNQSAYLTAETISDCSKRVFNIMKAEFLVNAYSFFLNYIGTDFYELKSAQSSSTIEEQLAERLGIPYQFGPTPDFPVQELYYNIQVFDINKGNPLGTGFTAGISALEDLLELIFGFKKDSTDPLLKLGDCQYLLWRREYTRTSWEDTDNPDNEFLTRKDYFIDPDLVNVDDVRFKIEITGYPVQYDTTNPLAADVLINRKVWSEKVNDWVGSAANKSSAGFIQNPDTIWLDLAYDSDGKIQDETLVSINKSIVNKAKALVNDATKFGVELVLPLEQDSFDPSHSVGFQIGYPVSSYDATLPEVTVLQNSAQYYSGTFLRFFNKVTKNSQLVEATLKSGSTTTFEFTDPTVKADLVVDFPAANAEIYFEVEVPVRQSGNTVTQGNQKVVIFSDLSSLFASTEVDFTVIGSKDNDGEYVSKNVANTAVTYAQGPYSDFDVITTEIPIKRTGLATGQKSFLVAGDGDGAITFERNVGQIAFYSNGYQFLADASGVSLEANNIEADDKVLLKDGSVYETITIADVPVMPGTDSDIVLKESLPASFLNLALTGTYTVEVLLEAVYEGANQLKVAGRDVDAFAGNVTVYASSDYTTPNVVTNIAFDGTDTIITVTDPVTSGGFYQLAIQNVAVKDVVQSNPYFKLAGSTIVPGEVQPGILVEVFNVSSVRLDSYSADGSNDSDILYVTSEITLSGEDELSYYPEFTILREFTTFAHSIGGASDIFSELADLSGTTSTFDYLSIYNITTSPTVWTLTGTSNFAELVGTEAANLKNGLTSTLPGELNLSKEAFLRFAELYPKYYNYLTTPAVTEYFSIEEAREFECLIRLSVKNALVGTPAWKDEEDTALNDIKTNLFPDIIRIQDPRIFQISQYGPKILEFKEPLYFDKSKPYLDGQFPLLAKVPQSPLGIDGRELLELRENEVSITKGLFLNTMNSKGLDGLISSIWGSLIPNTVNSFIHNLYQGLFSGNPDVVKKTRETLGLMGLDQSTFEKFYELRNEWKLKKLLPEAASIKEQLTAILFTSFKQSSTAVFWKAGEQDLFTGSGVLQYWLLKEENLVPWLSSSELRYQWLMAIASRQGFVAVDPDLQDIKFFVDITSTDPTIRAFNLLTSRTDKVLDWATPVASGGLLPAFPGTPVDDQEIAKFYAQYFLEVSGDKLDGMIDALNLGEDITSQLRQLNCTAALFYRVKSIIEALKPPAASLSWADIEDQFINILVEIRKMRTYCEWRDIEVIPPTLTDIPVIISPEFFKMPELAYSAQDNSNRETNWRFSERQLQAWKKIFKSRNLIWEALSANALQMLSEADDTTLLLLRDAYIELVAPETDSSGNKYSFEQKTSILSNRLLQDFAVQCCSSTTRVSTAISTLQKLFFILNTETDPELYPPIEQFKLVAPSFSKEWKWLGNYGSYRSAMFVNIYPENLLHPALRRTKTSKFAEITSLLNQGGVFTKETACEVANNYFDYMSDVTDLTPQCGANVNVLVKKGPCEDISEQGLKKTFFGFAISNESKRVYYVRQDAETDEDPCLNWIPLDSFGSGIKKIIAAAPGKKSSGKRYLYVFAHKLEAGKNSVLMLKYDLDESYWDEEPEEMEFPEGINYSSIVVLQRQTERQPVILFTKTVDKITSFWMNMINNHDDTWYWKEPIPMASSKWFDHITPIAAQEVEPFNGSVHPIGNMVVVYKYKDSDKLILQPFTPADKQKSFWYFGDLRPGKMYRVNKDLNLVPVNNGWENRDLVNGDDFRVVKFKGIYSYSEVQNKEFGVLLEDKGGAIKLLKGQFEDVVDPPLIDWFGNLNTEDKIWWYFYQYFNINLMEEMVKYSSGNQELEHSIFTLLDAGSRNDTLYSAKMEGLKHYVNNQLYYQESDPSWKIATIYLLAYTDFSNTVETSSIPDPKLDWGERPRFTHLFGRILSGMASRYVIINGIDNRWGKLLDWKYIYTITGEPGLKTVAIGEVANIKGISQTNFLWKSRTVTFAINSSGKHVLVKFNNAIFTSIATDYTVNLTPSTAYNGRITANNDSYKYQQRRVDLKNLFIANQAQCTFMNLYAEAYLFLPILLGLKLHEGGYYEDSLAWFRSVYDYNWKTLSERKIWYGLIVEESVGSNYAPAANWLLDPMNPHQIALTRAGAYTAYTVQSIIKCLLDYADQQFTTDTSETIPIATHLYQEVEALLNLSQFKPNEESCACGENVVEDIWMQLRCLPNLAILLEHQQAINDLAYLIEKVEDCSGKDTLIADAVTYFNSTVTTTVAVYDAIAAYQDAIITQIALNPAASTLPAFLSSNVSQFGIYADQTLSVSGFNAIAETVSTMSFSGQSQVFQQVTGYSQADLTDVSLSPLPFTILDQDGPTGVYTQGTEVLKDERAGEYSGGSSAFSLINTHYESLPITALLDESLVQLDFAPAPSVFGFCIPDNPVYESCRLRAELNLFKIRNCMNIAGMKRDVDAYAAATDATTGLPSIGAGGQLVIPGQLKIKPTQYRYLVLIQRAKELIQMAQQLEGMYLASLEKKDAETYNMMKAKQELKLSRAGVKLNNLKVRVAEGEVDLAKIQQERSELQVELLEGMIQEGLTQVEQQLIGTYLEIATSSFALAGIQTQISRNQAMIGIAGSVAGAATSSTYAIESFGKAGLKEQAKFALHTTAAVANATQGALYAAQLSMHTNSGKLQQSLALSQGKASVLSIMNSLEARQREWRFQKTLSEHDIKIGQQQVKVSQDRLRVSGQELKMAEMQQSFAEDSVEFLKNKFTNADLYSWMSRVLGSAFSSMLNEATAVAKMAMYQLMFDRQQAPPNEIADNYWEAPSMQVSLEPGSGPDRRGLTGSVRLQQDLVRMDQWGFTTDTRKQEVTKVISLARNYPLEFQQFRQTGNITFNTLMEHFDRDFPGQYMRIIRKVTTNVIALIPPTEGIKATLTSSGISDVVIKADRFQNTTIRRTPERIAISSPTNGTGMLELQPEGQQFFNPFEGNGVAMQWEFEMPIESNFLDYSTISDVLVTIQYTAMDSPDYRNEVLRKLPKEYEGERLYSLSNDFADQFYELVNPDQSSTPFVISFDTSSFDFPGNLKDYFIRGLRIMLLSNSDKLANPDPGEVKKLGLQFKPFQSNNTFSGNAILGKNNFAATFGQGGAGLQNFIGQRIDGTWTMDLTEINNAIGGTSANINPLKQLFEDGEISDILFVVDFGADFKNS